MFENPGCVGDAPLQSSVVLFQPKESESSPAVCSVVAMLRAKSTDRTGVREAEQIAAGVARSIPKEMVGCWRGCHRGNGSRWLRQGGGRVCRGQGRTEGGGEEREEDGEAWLVPGSTAVIAVEDT